MDFFILKMSVYTPGESLDGDKSFRVAIPVKIGFVGSDC